jgi:16S rRNA (guanine(966)-N(2))-methyltransferase RsmD
MQALDLYAGSGALGIEAISRGASHCLFVDRSRASCDLVRSNLTATELLPRASIWCKQTSDALKALVREGTRFHLILMDPPYGEGQALASLQSLSMAGILAPGALLVVETGSAELLPEQLGSLVQVDRRQYGSAALSFYQPEPSA